MPDQEALTTPYAYRDQVIARFPGVSVARDFTVNWGWGVRPDVHRIETTVNHLPAQSVGTFVLRGLKTGLRLALPYCRVHRISYPSTGRAEIFFEDRRWAWQQGSIDGDYNYYDPEKLEYRRQRSARALAQLLLDAMKEINYDVAALPTDSYPRRQWNGENPAEELERLAYEHGLVVCLDPITDRVTLCPIGQGAATPTGPAIVRVPNLVAPPLPSEVRIVGSSALFQSAFTLGRPLGRELDGRLVPIYQLSYTPPGLGWAGCSPWSFTQIDGSTVIDGQRVFHKDLAQESIWRYYELAPPSTGISPQPLVGTDYEPTSMADMGPFLDCRLEKDPLTDARMPIVVRGSMFVESQESANKSVNGEWTGDVRVVDPEKPIIYASRPLFRYLNRAFNPGPASGIVVIGHAIKKDGVQLRYEFRQPVTGAAAIAGPQIEYRDDMVREYIAPRAMNGGLGAFVGKDNVNRCNAQANYYLTSIAANLTELQAETVQLRGLRLDTKLDGAIRRLVWSGGTDTGPTTTVARNNEPNPYVIPWEQRPATVAVRIAQRVARRARADELVAKRKAGIL